VRVIGQKMRLFIIPVPDVVTMTRTIAVLAIAAMSLRGQDATDPLPASARDVSMVRLLDYGPEAPFMMCAVEFMAIVRNDRQTEIRIGSEPVHFVRADVRNDTGKGAGAWVRNMMLDWIGGDGKYDKCSVVPPGGTYELPKVTGSLHLKKIDGRIPPGATMRFHLAAACMDGKTIRSESVLTEAIYVDTSATPEKYIEPLFGYKPNKIN